MTIGATRVQRTSAVATGVGGCRAGEPPVAARAGRLVQHAHGALDVSAPQADHGVDDHHPLVDPGRQGTPLRCWRARPRPSPAPGHGVRPARGGRHASSSRRHRAPARARPGPSGRRARGGARSRPGRSTPGPPPTAPGGSPPSGAARAGRARAPGATPPPRGALRHGARHAGTPRTPAARAPRSGRTRTRPPRPPPRQRPAPARTPRRRHPTGGLRTGPSARGRAPGPGPAATRPCPSWVPAPPTRRRRHRCRTPRWPGRDGSASATSAGPCGRGPPGRGCRARPGAPPRGRAGGHRGRRLPDHPHLRGVEVLGDLGQDLLQVPRRPVLEQLDHAQVAHHAGARLAPRACGQVVRGGAGVVAVLVVPAGGAAVLVGDRVLPAEAELVAEDLGAAAGGSGRTTSRAPVPVVTKRSSPASSRSRWSTSGRPVRARARSGSTRSTTHIRQQDLPGVARHGVQHLVHEVAGQSSLGPRSTRRPRSAHRARAWRGRSAAVLPPSPRCSPGARSPSRRRVQAVPRQQLLGLVGVKARSAAWIVAISPRSRRWWVSARGSRRAVATTLQPGLRRREHEVQLSQHPLVGDPVELVEDEDDAVGTYRRGPRRGPRGTSAPRCRAAADDRGRRARRRGPPGPERPRLQKTPAWLCSSSSVSQATCTPGRRHGRPRLGERGLARPGRAGDHGERVLEPVVQPGEQAWADDHELPCRGHLRAEPGDRRPFGRCGVSGVLVRRRRRCVRHSFTLGASGHP